jgi:hypothetical protein
VSGPRLVFLGKEVVSRWEGIGTLGDSQMVNESENECKKAEN